LDDEELAERRKPREPSAAGEDYIENNDLKRLEAAVKYRREG
jgi:hypothetical protein